LIGDAAHPMTPFAGAGIKYAIEDAVVAANLLTAPLKEGRVRPRDLAAVQRLRERPTRVIQAFGALFLWRFGSALRSGSPQTMPRLVRLLFGLPFLSRVVARMVAFGFWRVHVQEQ
jgi:2-polyprenyl-6-methoxyphenol hydroxylase-like FAD-dependent oxidoreductase